MRRRIDTTRTKKKRGRLIVVALSGLLVFVGAISRSQLKSMGGRVSGARLERVRHSPHFTNGKFRNALPDKQISSREGFRQLTHWLFGSEERVPPGSIPVVVRHASDYAAEPSSDLRVTWIGHSSVLIEIDGRRILTDPVWSERASPLAWVGPKRFHPPPISLTKLPAIDVVVISHDHYDHLDMATIQTLAARGTHFAVPLGVGAHLESWGISSSQLSELDWGEQLEVASLKIVATPARHYSGRSPLHSSETLWASWVIQGPSHRVFFSGDTGYSDTFKSIGTTYGPFDVTLMKIGGSDPSWADIHMTPEEALRAHLDVRGNVLLPIHWGTFNVAFHSWSEPIERVVAAANSAGVTVAVPRPGQFVEPTQPPPIDHWWRSVQ
jgi:L-ascorbate metabolism protein UlaG (beta-lactamase superfamily)